MDDAARLRRKDTTKGPPLRILSLDGGGVRGYSMLIILQELMHRTFVEIEGRAPRRHEIPKPCDHFDLIAGTGTGGLIAIMLGRLRLDLDTCKDLYVRMTRRVFETDKMIAGIPFKSTMYKASKLEEVIREVVREHTVSEHEGNDSIANATPVGPDVAAGGFGPELQRTMSQSSRYSQFGMSPTNQQRVAFGSLALGNPNALLYDTRQNRTKTAVTAVLRGTRVTTFLRSYDSRKEPAPDVNCTVWQAGRATSALALAFKPIQIGQSVYLDEGGGQYNPAPFVLDEATVNEWPGRDVGVFVSVGTGKRPANSDRNQRDWWEGFLGGTVGEFAEARRRLISKLEGCEETHKLMLRQSLSMRGVDHDNYYRLNVEVGVGEFGMNEWARLSEVSINTRTYLAKPEIEMVNQSAAAKLAKIHFAKQRHDRAELRKESAADTPQQGNRWHSPWDRPLATVPPPSNPMAVELPGDDLFMQTQGFRPGAQHYGYRPNIADMKYTTVANDHRRAYSQDYKPPQMPPLNLIHPAFRDSYSTFGSAHHGSTTPIRFSYEEPRHASPRLSLEQRTSSPPPLPPKTPIDTQPRLSQAEFLAQSPTYNSGPTTFVNMGDLGHHLPYPDIEGPPPAVNTATKPQLPR